MAKFEEIVTPPRDIAKVYDDLRGVHGRLEEQMFVAMVDRLDSESVTSVRADETDPDLAEVLRLTREAIALADPDKWPGPHMFDQVRARQAGAVVSVRSADAELLAFPVELWLRVAGVRGEAIAYPARVVLDRDIFDAMEERHPWALDSWRVMEQRMLEETN